ncbi:MAG: hypothetical protein B7C24_18440 [Bacteroidetes bacterium 4572_77]|nr:MAG: hypothetical protein B7C24_18440 [Bacteroidetes bacterium 4572_77]
MAKRRAKENIYLKEKEKLQKTLRFLDSEDFNNADLTQEELKSASHNYQELLDQTILITRISDRLQKKLDKTNDQLHDKNEELQNTIDDLVKAKVGRKATTIVFVFALLLFIISEAFLEPYIDSYANDLYLSLAIKAGIAMLIKPIEMIVETTMLKRARRKTMEKPKL